MQLSLIALMSAYFSSNSNWTIHKEKTVANLQYKIISHGTLFQIGTAKSLEF